MPLAIPQTESAASIDTNTTPDLDTVGIEFEYPVAAEGSAAPATGAQSSSSLRQEWGNHNPWNIDGVPGEMTRDHVGAEITSGQLDLHSDEPERWYVGTIQRATEHGYPFAACGSGITCFGLHHHLSNLSSDDANFLDSIGREPWFRIFACGSVRPNAPNPWRIGGVRPSSLTDSGGARSIRPCDGPGHYEWRLPEPVLPDHFAMIEHFLRLLATDGQDAAREYARSAVLRADDRLTAVQQYRAYKNRLGGRFRYDNFEGNPVEAAVEGALALAEVMGDA